MNTATPKQFIGVVIYTMAGMALIFFVTLSICALYQIPVESQYYTAGGCIVTGMLAMLVNTRTSTADTAATATVTTTTEATNHVP